MIISFERVWSLFNSVNEYVYVITEIISDIFRI